MKVDLVVEGGVVLTLDSEWRIFDPGYVAVKDGAIVALGHQVEARSHEAMRRVSVGGRLIMPGFINTHTHIAMAAFRGAGEDMDDRLARFIFPMEKNLVTRRLVYEASRFCLAEMAKSGTTTFADMYYFEDEVARATKELGLRAVLGETIVNFPAPDAPLPHGGLEYGLGFIDAWKDDPLVTPCLAPHAPYTVEPGVLKEAFAESRRRRLPVLMHVAETDKEYERFRESHGSVLRYLDSLGCLGDELVAAHMIYVDDEDIKLLIDANVAIAHCPASNAKSGRPIAPVWKYEKAGLRIGLATDGPLSGNGMDMEGIVGLYPKLQKVLSGRRNEVSAREALRAATLGGAETLGLGAKTGSLEVGKRADLIIIDTDAFNLQPVYDWYSTAVYALRPHNVRAVMVDGKMVVEEGRMVGMDEEASKGEMRAIAEACRGEIGRLARELQP